MLFLLTNSPQKLKLEKIHGTLIILLYFSLTTDFSFFIKNTKHNHSSASDWWENTKSSFKEDAIEIFLKIQENIRISILDEL